MDVVVPDGMSSSPYVASTTHGFGTQPLRPLFDETVLPARDHKQFCLSVMQDDWFFCNGMKRYSQLSTDLQK
jgi:hypothetical protein